MALFGFAFSFVGSAYGQSALVGVIEAVSTNVSYVNGGGMSIISDGSLGYSGPLNVITPLQDVVGVRVVLNEVVLIDGVPAEVQALVESGRSRSNQLSPELQQARIDVRDRDSVMLGIGGRVPMPVAIGGSTESRRIEQVTGQSMSVFPDLQPSVFSRTVLLP